MSNSILPPKSDLINNLNDIYLYSSTNNQNFKFTSDQLKNIKKFLLDMWNEKNVNFTENKKSLHYACRFYPKNIGFSKFKNKLIDKELFNMFSIAKKIKDLHFHNITDIIHLGTGGSNLGPQLIYDCFKHNISIPKCHFISNLDPSQLSNLLKTLNPSKTLVFTVSKSFTTQETITNLERLRSWFKNTHSCSNYIDKIYAVTSSYELAIKNHFPKENIVFFNENIGGRFSIWSAANILSAVVFGHKLFNEFLSGGHSIDEQVYNNFEQSIPISLSEISFFSRTKNNIYSHCIVPYSDDLKLLPLYLQQLLMESNGKSINDQGKFTQSPSTNVFGYSGTDAQHSFFQSLHQSTLKTSIDLISFKRLNDNYHYIDKDLDDYAFNLLNLNCYAQYETFKNGDKNHKTKNIHHSIIGEKTVNYLMFDQLNFYTLGQIISIYEYKTIIEAALSKTNPFDQFGVDLGKKIVKTLI